MALILKDRVKESSSSSGTGNITLGGAFPGYQTFNAAVASGSTVYYTIHNLAAGFDTEWEVGVGTFTSPSTLSRDTVLSSSTGSLINFTAGGNGLEVFITQPAEEAVYINQATGKVEAFGNGTNTITFTEINTTNLTANTVTLTSGTITTNAANATDITNKTYVDGLFSTGISYHDPVRVESPTALSPVTYNNGSSGVGATLTNAGTQTALVIDGITVNLNDRVLIYTQTDQTQNGIYTVTNVGSGSTNWVLTRATDADTYGVADPNKLGQGDAVFVQSGNTGAGETYICNTPGTITFGTTNITFAQISSAQVYSAGTGLNLSNLTFSIANTAVTAAQYGDGGNVAQVTVNAQGQLTNAANVAINASSISAGTLAVARGGTGTGTAGIGAFNNITGFSASGTSGTTSSNLLFSISPSIISPTISTSIISSGATFTLANSASTTINFAGAATTLNQGVSTANLTHNYSTGATLSGNTKTINLGTNGVSGSTTNVNIGSANGTTVTVNGTTNLSNVNVSGNVSVGGSISGNGGALTSINASNISSGTIDNSRTTAASANGASTIVQRDSGGNFSANTITANISGDISGGTNINASNITSGTIANARTTASSSNGASTIVLRDAGGAFAAGAITGTSFSGNGSSITDINASAITTGTIANARTSASSANGASTIVLRDANGDFAADAITANFFIGDGSNVSAINGSNVTTGTVANARTTAASANGASTIVARDANGSFTANVGTFTTVSGAGGGLTGINASNISTGTIANARTTASDANGASTIVSRSAAGSFAGNVITATTFSGSGASLTNIPNSATTANSANGASTIVARDTNGSFVANVVTATNFSGGGAAISAINASNLSSGTVATARLASGTANSSTYLRGDSTWAALSAPNNGTLTMNTSGTGISGSATFTADQSGNTTFTVTSNASSANGASTLVARDASGSFAANIITAGAGSNTAPSITTAGDTNTGIYFPAADTMALTRGGSELVRIDAAGVGINGAATIGYRLDVNGATRMNAGASEYNQVVATAGSASGFQFFRSGYNSWYLGSLNNNINFAIGESLSSPSLYFASGGNVGIGNTNPTSKLDVTGTCTASSFSGAGTGLTGTASSLTAGTATTANALNTGNNYQVNSLGVGTAASGTTGEIRATNNITAYYSDERLKTKTGDIENALDKVCQIETMLYHANEVAVELGYDASIQEVGVTAQSVQKVQPEVVVPAPIDEKYLTVRYEKLVPLLIEAVKELKAEVDVLKGK